MKNVIYKIEIKDCDRFYIGSAVNFKTRKAHHFSQLRANRHRNEHLQNIYDKYGEDKFSFVILEQVDEPNALLKVEQKWIDSYDFSRLINICPVAGNTLGRFHSDKTKAKISENHYDVSSENNPMFGKKGDLSPNYGRKHSDETKEKISQVLKGKKSWSEGLKRPEHSEKMKGENNFWHGKSLPEETKQKISDSRKKMLVEKGGQKLTIEIVREIRRRYNSEKISIVELAKEYGIAKTYCGQLLKGVYWKDD